MTDQLSPDRVARDWVARAWQGVRVLCLATGLAALGFGLAGLFGNPRPTDPPNSVAWLVGGVLVHDLVVAPAAVVVGFVLSRLVRPPYRSVVQGALIVSAAVAAASLPLWLGYGGAPGNWTVNPLPYRRNLLA
nr:hypothetical protein [Micromonospora sp. DSM 115978]